MSCHILSKESTSESKQQTSIANNLKCKSSCIHLLWDKLYIILFSLGQNNIILVCWDCILFFVVCNQSENPKFNTGRLCPEVQPLTHLYTILAEKVPLLYTFY